MDPIKEAILPYTIPNGASKFFTKKAYEIGTTGAFMLN